MKIAVMGSTGNVGRELVGLLASEGHSVIALSSKRPRPSDLPPGVQGFAVDLNRGSTLRDALEDVEGAFMLSGYDDSGLIGELERGGVRRVALLSSGAVQTTGPDNAVSAYHLASERALEGSHLSWTFLRPNSFMTNSLRWAGAVRAGSPIVVPFADVPIACNDPRDIAAVAAAALLSPDHAGKPYRITGPQALLPAEQVEILADVLGRELRFEPQSNEAARREMEASMPVEYVDAFFQYFVEGKADETTVLPTVEEVTGSRPRTFRQWATEHAEAFR